mmetsp:Transcript_61/g.151  ORF Transcript_61/g.151 Transcript_61/m.151 type:complete len:106 (+) Transcript_61:82-399(+)
MAPPGGALGSMTKPAGTPGDVSRYKVSVWDRGQAWAAAPGGALGSMTDPAGDADNMAPGPPLWVADQAGEHSRYTAPGEPLGDPTGGVVQGTGRTWVLCGESARR